MPKRKSVKKPNKLTNRSVGRRPLLFVVGAVVVLVLAILIPKLTSNIPALPSKYLNPGATDETPISFNGSNASTNSPSVYRGESVRIQSDSVYGEDIYVAIGDPPNVVVLKTIKAKTIDLDTTVVIPKDYRTGTSGFHIYFTVAPNDTVDRASTIYVTH